MEPDGTLPIPAVRRWAVAAAGVVVVLLAVSLSGCGGGGSALKCSGDATAVDLGSGAVCADSGFRTSLNDFAFPNWGGVDSAEEEATAGTLIALYGANQVCASGSTAADCVLTPVAAESLTQLNTSLGGGRCEGLAVLSVRYHLGLDDPSKVESSASLTHELVRPQPTLDAQIVEWWATQFAPEVLAKAASSRKKDPVKLVEELAGGLANGGGYTIGIYGEGEGHAVTPFAVTKRDKQYVVHIYDNNYPGERREIIVDPATKSWSYDGATQNPDGSPGTWSGTTGTFEITPMDVRVPTFTSPFASKSESVKGSVKVRLAMKSSPDDPAAGLLVTTASGKRFGIVDGALVSDVEGGNYTVGKGGIGNSMVEVEIPDLGEEYAVQPVAATSEGSSKPIEATLSVVSADGTSTFMKAEVPLAVATPTSDPASLGSAVKIAPDAGVTVEARGTVSVTVATNQGKVEAALSPGQSLVMQPSEGASAVKVVAQDGTVVREASVARTDSPPKEETAPVPSTTTTTLPPTTTTTIPPSVAPILGPLAVPTATYGQAGAITIAPPTSTSGGTFTFSSSDPSVATIDPTSGALTIVGGGETTITATQAPTRGFLGGAVSAVLVVQRATPTIGPLNIPSAKFGQTGLSIAAPTSNSSGAFSFSSADPSVATIDPSSGRLTIVGVGSTTITAVQAASRNYATGSVSATLTVQRATPTIGALSLPSVTYGQQGVTVAAPSSNSPGAFSFSSSDTSVATIDPVSGAVRIVAAGTTTVTATQAVTPNFVAGSVSATLTVQRATPTIGALSLPSVTYGQQGATVTAPSSNSPGTFTFSSSDTSIATIDPASGALTLTGVGVTSITALQAASPNFIAGAVSGVLTVQRAAATFGSFTLASRRLADGVFNATAPTSNSDGAASWSSSDTSIATIDASTGLVTPVALGSTTITFARAATANFEAGSTTATLTITNHTVVTFDTLPAILRSSASTVYIDTTPGPTQNTIRTDGSGSWWYFETGSVGDVTGDFHVGIDVYFPSGGGREIANFAFWITNAGGSSNGYMYRMQNAGGDSGWFSVNNGSHSGIRTFGDVTTSLNTWYHLDLTAVGSTVTAVVSNRDTGAVLSTSTITLPGGNRAGVFGQKQDGAGRQAGQRWDNFTIH